MRAEPRAIPRDVVAWSWLLSACGFAFDLAAWWPGQMSYDSAYAWWQARGGGGNDIVPPAFTLAWRVSQHLADGPGAVFALHALAFWCGLALFTQAFARSLAAAAATLLLAFAPPLLLLRGHAWTDVGVLSALVLAAGALARAQVAARNRGWLALALPALVYGSVVRHNGITATLPLDLWWAWIACAGARGNSARVRVAVLTLVLVLFETGSARLLAAGTERHTPVWPLAAVFDLAALSIATDRVELPAFMVGPGMDAAEIGAAFRPWSALPLLTGTRHGIRQPFEPPLDEAQLRELRRRWFDAIRAEPIAWLAHRLRVSAALFGTHGADWPRGLIYEDGEYAYGDNPPVPANAGALHRALMHLAGRPASLAWLAAWPWLLLGLVALPRAWRRRDEPAGVAALALAASAWSYALPMCVLAASAELRYVGWSCAASLLAAAAAFAPRTVRTARLEPNDLQGMPMATVQRYIFTIDDLPKARGESHELSFQGGSAESFAALLQQALREPVLWQRWKAMQPDPDAVDPGLGASDPAATVEAHQSDVHVSVDVRSSLPHAVIKHRMTLLVGKHWSLRDVSAA